MKIIFNDILRAINYFSTRAKNILQQQQQQQQLSRGFAFTREKFDVFLTTHQRFNSNTKQKNLSSKTPVIKV